MAADDGARTAAAHAAAAVEIPFAAHDGSYFPRRKVSCRFGGYELLFTLTTTIMISRLSKAQAFSPSMMNTPSRCRFFFYAMTLECFSHDAVDERLRMPRHTHRVITSIFISAAASSRFSVCRRARSRQAVGARAAPRHPAPVRHGRRRRTRALLTGRRHDFAHHSICFNELYIDAQVNRPAARESAVRPRWCYRRAFHLAGTPISAGATRCYNKEAATRRASASRRLSII